jgi:lipoprotein-anchoring transpeptidase ErfK/SrfK
MRQISGVRGHWPARDDGTATGSFALILPPPLPSCPRVLCPTVTRFHVRRRAKKYQFASSRKHAGNFGYWLLALALAAVLVAVWWKSGRKPHAKPHPPTVAVARPVIKPPAPVTPFNQAPSEWPRPVQNVFEAQLALVQQGISPGSLDGVSGSQTRAALAAFQEKTRLPVTGILDDTTKNHLLLTNAPYTTYIVTSNDLARLQPLSTTWLGKSQQTALDYETILELVAEKSFSHPDFIRRLNPSVDWTNVPAGTVLRMPDAVSPEVHDKAAFVVIHLSAKTLEAFDENTNLLVHFPCSIARLVEKRPVGELHVQVVAPNPNYTFDPDVFPESAEAKQLNRKLILPPGPNNPVGVAWIGLDLPGYGIHGTPSPEQVGRTESHGCFRLANWNAEYLVHLVEVGTPVYVEE